MDTGQREGRCCLICTLSIRALSGSTKSCQPWTESAGSAVEGSLSFMNERAPIWEPVSNLRSLEIISYQISTSSPQRDIIITKYKIKKTTWQWGILGKEGACVLYGSICLLVGLGSAGRSPGVTRNGQRLWTQSVRHPSSNCPLLANALTEGVQPSLVVATRVPGCRAKGFTFQS
jgi:hypothetical protein